LAQSLLYERPFACKEMKRLHRMLAPHVEYVEVPFVVGVGQIAGLREEPGEAGEQLALIVAGT
jgi:hypothetical protein